MNIGGESALVQTTKPAKPLTHSVVLESPTLIHGRDMQVARQEKEAGMRVILSHVVSTPHRKNHRGMLNHQSYTSSLGLRDASD